MTDTPLKTDIWHWLTLVLWGVFFVVGLFPEYVFFTMRALGGVPAHRAMINSYHVITLGLAAYLYFFSVRRGIEAGLQSLEAHGKALQLAIFGLLAFLPVAQIVIEFRGIPIAGLRNLVLGIGAAKLLAWVYLYTVIIRYYCIDGPQVFRQMRSLFPSAHKKLGQPADDAPDPAA